MKHAIEILEQHLKKNQIAEEEEDDLFGAVASMRVDLELRTAIKVLKTNLSLFEDIKHITWL